MVRDLENRSRKGEVKNRECSLKSQTKIFEVPMWKGEWAFTYCREKQQVEIIQRSTFFIARPIFNRLERPRLERPTGTPSTREAEEARGSSD